MVNKPESPRPDPSARQARGFMRAFGLVTPQLRAAARRHGFAESRLLTHWAEIAGPDIAAIARPVKMRPGRGASGGTLVLQVEGVQAPLLQMMLPGLRARIAAACGLGAVGRIQITQTTAAGFAEAPAQFHHAPPGPPPEAMAEVVTELSSIGDRGLRAALETLAQNVLSRAAAARMRKPR